MNKQKIHNVAFLIMDISKCGGTERVTSVLANSLSKYGFNVSIISCQNGENCFFEISDSVSLLSINGERYKNSFIRKYMCYRNLRNIIHSKKIDLLISVDVALYLYAFIFRSICKCISWEQFTSDICISILMRFARFLSTRYADSVVVLSDHDRENYIKKYKYIKKIVTIYNPITIKEISNEAKRNRTIISVGRLEYEKGFDNLIEAWKNLEPQFPGWTVNIFGDGSQKNQLESQIRKLELKRIFLKGYTTRVEDELSTSQIYVLPSRYEGFGLALLEARMASLPCISFNCKYGPAEIIEDGINGILVEDQNIEALAGAMKELMINNDKRERMSRNANKNLSKYSADFIVKQWAELIDAL